MNSTTNNEADGNMNHNAQSEKGSTWEQEYHEYCLEKEAKLAEKDKATRKALHKTELK